MSETNDYNDSLESKPISKKLLITLGCVTLIAVAYIGHMFLGGSSFGSSSSVNAAATTPHKVYAQSPASVSPAQPNLKADTTDSENSDTSNEAPKSEVDTTLSQYSQLTNELNLLNMQNQINTSKIAVTKSNLELASLIPSPAVVKDESNTNKSKTHSNKTLSVGMIYSLNDDMHAKLNTPQGKINVVVGSTWGDGQYTVTDIDSSSVTYTHDDQTKKLYINPLNAVEPS